MECVMKRILNKIVASVAAMGFAVISLSACDAMWDTSMDVVPGYYGVGFDNEWWPSLPGAPLVSPVYWGGQIYPGSLAPPIRPPYRPDYRPTPVPPSNGGIGNIRPGDNTRPAQPSQPAKPIVPPAGTIRPGAVTGGEPGVVMPPEGSGMRPGRH